MGMKHKAKKGTIIEVNGVKVIVLAGSPKLEIEAPKEAVIAIRRPASVPDVAKRQT